MLKDPVLQQSPARVSHKLPKCNAAMAPAALSPTVWPQVLLVPG